MSVPTWQRKDSPIKYVTNAKSLLNKTLQNCLKFPKRFTYLICNGVIEQSRVIYRIIMKINKLNDIEERLEERLFLCQDAISELESFASFVEELLVYSQSSLSSTAWGDWAQVIWKEISLLKGLMIKIKEDMRSLRKNDCEQDIEENSSDEPNSEEKK